MNIFENRNFKIYFFKFFNSFTVRKILEKWFFFQVAFKFMVIVFHSVLLRQISYPRRSFVFQFSEKFWFSRNCQQKRSLSKNDWRRNGSWTDSTGKHGDRRSCRSSRRGNWGFHCQIALFFTCFWIVFRLHQIHRKKSVTKTVEFTSMGFTSHLHLHQHWPLKVTGLGWWSLTLRTRISSLTMENRLWDRSIRVFHPLWVPMVVAKATLLTLCFLSLVIVPKRFDPRRFQCWFMTLIRIRMWGPVKSKSFSR